MNEQIRVRRDPFYFTIPIVLFVLTLILLLWAIVRVNFPVPDRLHWPLRLDLLDIQSATTAATITGGLIFARAQYETAVSPMIGWMGSIVESEELSDGLVWLVRLVNGSTSPSVFHSLQYHVRLAPVDVGQESGADVAWVSHHEAVKQIESVGLIRGVDYDLPESGHRFPLSVSSPYHLFLCLLTKKAMGKIDDILIRVSATDQARDTHQMIIYCLRGAVRDPKGVSIPFDV